MFASPPFVVLDFADPGDAGSLLFGEPVRELCASSLDEVSGVLEGVQRAADEGLHAVGFVSYEAAPAFDGAYAVRASACASRDRASLPLAWFGVFREPRLLDESLITVGHVGGVDRSAAASWLPSVSRDEYDAAIASIRDSIGRGEVYQVNHTLRLRRSAARSVADDFALYQRLRDAQRASYAAYIDLGAHRILSASPELFFERTGDEIVCRPMKGTSARGRWAEEDEARAESLAASEKERAENVMIVDLVRNDLGRIARAGTVRVERLFDVERYPTVLQLTSTVAATVAPATTVWEIFAALFPCGSITGAPKVAATRQIAALEDSPRGVYCGAIGHVRPGGDATFNVAIRTVHVDVARGISEYGVGGGITWDSLADAEYDETVAKTAILVADPIPEFGLLETMRAEGATIPLLRWHLERLASSARYFGFAFSESDVHRALAAQLAPLGNNAHRVRLVLDRAGRASITTTPTAAPTAAAATPLRVALAARPVRARDPFLHHKTTHRRVYEEARAEALPDVDDVLLWNEEGELTELTIANLVVELGGIRVTPPRESGVLGGVFRRTLLESGAVIERTLHVDDLRRATRLWRVNAVRGWETIEIVTGSTLHAPRYL